MRMKMQRSFRRGSTYLIAALVVLTAATGLYRGSIHLVALKADTITVNELPEALLLSFFRMTVAYFLSLAMAFSLGLLAGVSRFWERLILPVIDVFQSIPIVAFFPAAISFFISLSSGHRLGIETAAIFLIFTSQAWNLIFAVYEAVTTIPQDNTDAVRSFGLKGSHRFFRLYGPACIPRMVYNSILSWSNGWFFLVACEIIAVGQIEYHLPGIGSFLARSAEANNLTLVMQGLAALTALVLTMDFLIWRPLSVWSERFKQVYSESHENAEPAHSLYDSGNPKLRWIRGKFQGTLKFLSNQLKPIWIALQQMISAGLAFMLVLLRPFAQFFLEIILRRLVLPLSVDAPIAVLNRFRQRYWVWTQSQTEKQLKRYERIFQIVGISVFATVGIILGVGSSKVLSVWLAPPWPEVAKEIPMALAASTLRLTFALLVSVFVALGLLIWLWNRPKLRALFTTFAQIGASLPATALFPVLLLIATQKLGGGLELATLLMLLTGMVWYLVFNALGGAAAIPQDLAQIPKALGMPAPMAWKTLVIPACRPALMTGAITAWGGGWNALVVAEYVKFQGDAYQVRGIGSLIARSVYELGDNRAIMLCVAGMIAWILLTNTLVWRPLYRSTAERYRLDI